MPVEELVDTLVGVEVVVHGGAVKLGQGLQSGKHLQRVSILTRLHRRYIVDIPSVHLAAVVHAIPANLLATALAGASGARRHAGSSRGLCAWGRREGGPGAAVGEASAK